MNNITMQKNEAWQRFVFVSVFFCSLIYSQPIEYLVKTNTDVVNNISVIELIDEQALLVADEGVLQEFKQAGIHYVVLDKNPRDNFYLFVFPVAEDLTSISRFGTILDQYDECVLLRTTRDQIPELNKLKVELSRLTLKPIVKRDASFYDFENIDVTRDTLIQQMLDDVEPDSILESVLRLQHFYTRYSMSDSNKIAVVNWIRDKLDAYGCDSVYTQNFSNNYGDNVVGIERGKRFPSTQKYVLIGGHLDDVPSFGYAPGADDNASGTTAMLEAARVMKDFNFEHTIRFIGFNAEEQGLIGSYEYATNAYNQGDTILGVFNFDMIGYVQSANRDTMRAYYSTAIPGCSIFVCEFFQAVADTYTQLKILQVRTTGTSGGSDHASFWVNGFKAMLGIERTLCPGYHSIGDTIGPTGV
ncbi:MAG: M20/M25/M40 family metallo-hydrolase, partial [Thermoplasmata archaeon]|nr:M20/M25/M40 family metallo-hydrolase [Thermoplasmata archaeon]